MNDSLAHMHINLWTLYAMVPKYKESKMDSCIQCGNDINSIYSLI